MGNSVGITYTDIALLANKEIEMNKMELNLKIVEEFQLKIITKQIKMVVNKEMTLNIDINMRQIKRFG